MIAAGKFVRDHLPPDLDKTARLVALAIALYTDSTGSGPVSNRQLQATTGLHAETIAQAIRRLEEAGVVAVQRRDRRVSHFRFPVTANVELSTAARVRTAQLSYPHLRGNGVQTARLRTAQLKRPTEENARADGSLWISGTGWCAPRAQGA
jgi:DNA-binding transcriptional ArsR family regulator